MTVERWESVKIYWQALIVTNVTRKVTRGGQKPEDMHYVCGAQQNVLRQTI